MKRKFELLFLSILPVFLSSCGMLRGQWEKHHEVHPEMYKYMFGGHPDFFITVDTNKEVVKDYFIDTFKEFEDNPINNINENEDFQISFKNLAYDRVIEKNGDDTEENELNKKDIFTSIAFDHDNNIFDYSYSYVGSSSSNTNNYSIQSEPTNDYSARKFYEETMTYEYVNSSVWEASSSEVSYILRKRKFSSLDDINFEYYFFDEGTRLTVLMEKESKNDTEVRIEQYISTDTLVRCSCMTYVNIREYNGQQSLDTSKFTYLEVSISKDENTLQRKNTSNYSQKY